MRPGDFVQLVDDVELLQRLAGGHGGFAKDMPDYIGEVARVTSIRGNRVSTDGLGGYVYNIRMLKKVHPASNIGTKRRPTVGDEVKLSKAAEDKKGLGPDECGFIVEDDQSWRPYRVRLPNGNMRWYRPRDLELVEPSNEDASISRLFSIYSI